jgi:hypothetical protein
MRCCVHSSEIRRDHVDNHLLEQFPEFQDFKSRARTTQQPPGTATIDPLATATTDTAEAVVRPPQETITAAVENNAAVAADVLSRVQELAVRLATDVAWILGNDTVTTPSRHRGGGESNQDQSARLS